ncbi:sensor histidine kinase [Saccharothrix sp. NRRL B-16348]|uniref:sensor histidine kinase n=1 Tax=Saccharothrix sp. NRRL B-16348 TaxID=1415542 RepID=UPI000ACA2BB2|nr:histidine kinase [Saccharothrix sp. NRRL B-16348]
MARTALPLAVVVADTGVAWLEGTSAGGLAAHAALTAVVMVLAARRPLVAFPLAVTLALLTGGALALLACTSYQAGRHVASRRDLTLTVVAAFAYPAVLLVPTQRLADEPWPALARIALLVALPLVAGVHLTRQAERLRRERRLHAERERLRERLRIAVDMHDSLGRWLSLVSVQAAALEVAPLPADQRPVARNLAHAARTAVDELHAVVATLRDSPGLDGVDELVEQFRRAGVAVTVERSGPARPLATGDAGHAAYRVVQEGLTNAARHAPGEPVAVSLTWEPDALLVGVANPTRGPVRDERGTGLVGLSERVRSAGGLLRVHVEPAGFRLVAMLPVAPDRVEAVP